MGNAHREHGHNKTAEVDDVDRLAKLSCNPKIHFLVDSSSAMLSSPKTLCLVKRRAFLLAVVILNASFYPSKRERVGEGGCWVTTVMLIDKWSTMEKYQFMQFRNFSMAYTTQLSLLLLLLLFLILFFLL